jgi:hypothetical protein
MTITPGPVLKRLSGPRMKLLECARMLSPNASNVRSA